MEPSPLGSRQEPFLANFKKILGVLCVLAVITNKVNPNRMVYKISFLQSEKAAQVAALGVAAGMIAAAFLLPGGDDLYRYYQPFAQGCLDCGFVPHFAQWFLWPLALVEYPLAWPLWTILSAGLFLLLARRSGANPFLLLISFSMLGQVWLGQVDVIICAGLLLLLLSRNPYLRGVGIVLALVKPQLTGLPILTMLLLENRRDLLRVLAAPLLVVAVSLFVYGLAWPLEWLQNAHIALPLHVWRLASASAWKYGLLLLPAPLLFKDRRSRLLASLLVSSVATPFFGVYSYVTFLLFDKTWWAAPLSFAWLLAYPWLQENAMQFAWILPLALFGNLLWQELKSRRQLQAGQSHA